MKNAQPLPSLQSIPAPRSRPRACPQPGKPAPAFSCMPVSAMKPMMSTSSMHSVRQISVADQGLPVAARQMRKMATTAAAGGRGGTGRVGWRPC